MEHLTEDQKIQADVDALRHSHSQTRDLYLEVCKVLFFKYGVTPTANKLYQYVKKGSMSAPAEALKKFWKEMRIKNQVVIDHPGIPDWLTGEIGELLSNVWIKALAAAEANYKEMREACEQQIREAQDKSARLQEALDKKASVLHLIEAELKDAKNTLQETEKKLAIHTSTLAAYEKSLQTLKTERDQAQQALTQSRQGFSSDLDKLHVALHKAEERYRSLETRSLLDLDKERQHGKQRDQELSTLKKELSRRQQTHEIEIEKARKLVGQLREVAAGLKGELKNSTLYQKRQDQQIRLLNAKLAKQETKQNTVGATFKKHLDK